MAGPANAPLSLADLKNLTASGMLARPDDNGEDELDQITQLMKETVINQDDAQRRAESRLQGASVIPSGAADTPPAAKVFLFGAEIAALEKDVSRKHKAKKAAKTTSSSKKPSFVRQRLQQQRKKPPVKQRENITPLDAQSAESMHFVENPLHRL